MPFASFPVLECLMEKIDACRNHPEYSSTIVGKVGEHVSSGFSMSTTSSFKSIENKHGKDCMKNFCESLRDHAMKIINFKKKKKMLLTK